MLASDIVLGDSEVLVSESDLRVTGTDFVIDNAGRRTSPNPPHRRALVHGEGDKLIINFEGDYPSGTEVESNLVVMGDLHVESNLNVGI